MPAYTLPKVPGTQQRGTTYHFNLPIPTTIRDLYDNKAAFRGTMKTSDPKEAEAKIRFQRTIFDQQLEDRAREEDRERLSKLLTNDQKAALDAVGGTGEIPSHIAELRKAAAFLTAGEGATEYLADDEEANLMSEIQHRAELAANAAYREALVAEIRGTKRIANSLKIEVPEAIRETSLHHRTQCATPSEPCLQRFRRSCRGLPARKLQRPQYRTASFRTEHP